MKLFFLSLLVLSTSLSYSQSEADYRRILKSNPTSIDAYEGLIALANTRELITKVGQEAIDAVGPRFQIYTALGTAYDKIRDFNNSVKYYRLALSVNPRSYTAYNRLGLALLNIGFSRQAEVAFKAANSIAPQNNSIRAVYLTHLAITYENLKNIEEAKKIINLALTINPNYTPAQTVKARLNAAK